MLWKLPILKRIGTGLGNNFIWILVFIVGMFAYVLNPVFLSSQNLLNILNANAYLACMVLGVSLVLITGNIDISIEANMGFSAAVGGLLMLKPATTPGVLGGPEWPWPLALMTMLGLSSLIGLFNGFMVVKLRINSLILTLATMIGLVGLAYVLGGGFWIYITSTQFRYIGLAQIGPVGVAVPFVLVVFIIAAVVTRKTIFGAHLYAVGGNRQASRAAGINDDRVVILAFVLCGFLSGLSAFILMGRLGVAGGGVLVGGALFHVIAAAVIGGVSLYGGRGGVGGMAGGVLLMGMIANILNLMAIPVGFVNVMRGTIILIALGIDAFRRRGKARE